MNRAYIISIPQKCSAGHYCPRGTPQPLPCDPGTFSDKEGLLEASQCSRCPKNYFCPTPGATDDKGRDHHCIIAFLINYIYSGCECMERARLYYQSIT